MKTSYRSWQGRKSVRMKRHEAQAPAARSSFTIERLETRVLLSSVLYRVNAGGEALSTIPAWTADTVEAPSDYTNQAASNSRPFSTSAAVDLTHPSIPAGTPVALLQTQRFDTGGTPMEWDFPVPAGQYQVNLYFAEIGAGQQAAGARVFDVSIEGAVTLDNYDVYAEVGGYKGVVKSFTVASDTNLDVDFAEVTENPMVQAIEVVQLSAPNALGVSAGALNYGNVRSGDVATQPITLTNLGAAGDPVITVNSTSLAGADAASFSDNFNDASPVALTPGQSITVNVTFTPASVGTKSANLQVSHTGVSSPLQVALSGNATATTANQLGVSASSFNFGDVVNGQTGERTVTLTNLGLTGDPSLLVDATTLSGTDAGQFSDNFNDAANVLLAPGQSTDVLVHFSPTSTGAKTATLNVAHAGANTPVQISLSGNALAVPPTNQAPVVNAGADQTITLPSGATLAGTASDDGLPTGSTLSTTWSKFSGPGTVTFGNAEQLGTTVNFSVDGTYVLRLTGSDGTLSSTDDITVVVNPSAGGTGSVAYRIEVGGNALAGTPGWTADTSSAPSPYTNAVASDSKTNSTSSVVDLTHPSIPAGTPSGVFRTQRYDGGGVPMEWDFPVTPGSYIVNLFFAEVGTNQQSVGARFFDVSIEGALSLDNYDIFNDVGGFKGVMKSFTVTSDANLDIDFAKVKQNPQIQGIEILQVGGSGPINQAPVVNAGADQTITLPAGATLAGTATDDGLPVGSSVTTTWAQFSGPGTVTFDNANNLGASASFSAAGTYVLRLTGSDGTLSSTDDVTIVVNPQGATNAAPVVNAGTDQTITLPSGVTLAGAASDDGLPAGSSLTSTWTKFSGPGNVTFGNANALNSTANFSADGTYVLRLTGSDGTLSSTDDVTIVVNPAATGGTGTVVYRVEAGGSALAGTPGWSADTSSAPSPYTNAVAAGSKTNSTSGTVDLTHPSIPAGTPSGVFRTQRYDGGDVPMLWDFPVTPGNYKVNLYFAEVGSNQQAIGARYFDVTVENTLVLNDYDIFAEVGGFKGVMKSFTVASDANLDIDFGKVKQNPQIQGIEIIHLDGGPTNAAPVVSAGTDQTITLPASVTLAGTASDDGLPAGSSLTTMWTKFSGPGTVTFGNANALNSTASFSAAGTYVLRLTGSDGTLSSTDDVTIVVNPAGATNAAPVVNAGTDQTITLPSGATLAGTASDDGLPTGSALTTTWTKFSGPGTVTFGNANTLNSSASFSAAGTYVLRLTGSDGTLSSTDDMTIVVNPAASGSNLAPVVNAGADQSIVLPGQISLAGTTTDDGKPVGGALSRVWTKVSGPGTVSFANALANNTTAAVSAAGTYVLRLTASDGTLSTSDDITINASLSTAAQSVVSLTLINSTTDQPIPGFDPIPNGAVINFAQLGNKLNIRAHTNPTTVGSVKFGYDSNSNYSMENGAPYALASNSGSDYKDWTPTLGTHSVTATPYQSSNGGGAAGTPVTVQFTVINQAVTNAPPTVNAGADQSITLPAAANLSGIVTDDGLPIGGATTRAWTKTSGPGAVTFGNANSLTTSATFSVAGTYVLRLTASDGTLSQFDELTITANGTGPANVAPVVNAGADQTITLPAGATLAGTASDDGLPAGSSLTTTWTKFSGPGTVTFGNAATLNSTVNFSAAGTYVLRLTGSDGTLSSTDDVTIVVNPASATNAAPVVNAGADQTITLPSGVTLAGTASDDGLPTGSALTTMWTKFSGPGAVTFGNANALNSTANFSVQGTYVLRLTGSDGTLSSTDDVTIVVNPASTGGGTIVYRVEAGGGALAGTPGWEADTSAAPSPFTNAVAAGSKTHSTSATIDMTHPSIPAGTPSGIFRTQRYDGGDVPMLWDFPVAAGNYTVNLYLAEVGANQQAVGARLFDVTLEGNLVLNDYDIFAEVGGFKGVVKSFAVTSDANLNIDFGKVKQNPQIQAIEIIHQNGGTPTNAAPVVNAGTDQTITLPANATLAGTATDDGLPAGSSLTTTWTKFSGPGTVTFGNAATLNSTASFSEAGTYVLRLTGSDGTLSSTDDVTIVVNPVTTTNQAPVVDAGTDQTITLPSNATLAGAASDDGLPAGSSLTTTWSKFSGPGTVTFGNASQLGTSASFSAAGTYVLRLTGGDGALSSTDDVTIVVNPASTSSTIVHRVNAGGAATAGTPGWSVDTGSSPSPFSNVAIAGSSTASTGNTIDLTHASVPAGTPEAIFKAQRYDNGGAPMEWDFPVTAGPFDVRLYFAETSTNQQAVDARKFNVSIEGTVVLSGYDVFAEVGANKGVVKTFSVTSDANLDIDFAAVVQNPMVQGIEIISTNGAPVNQAPTVNAGTDQIITLPASATLAGTASDDGLPTGSSLTTTWTQFSGAGTVTFGNANVLGTTASFSAAGTYMLRLTGSDGTLSSTDDVTVVVNPDTVPNQPPTANAGADQTITLPAAASLTGTASDDGLPAGSSLTTTWSKFSGPGTVNFGNSASLSTTASFSTNGQYVLRLTASDGTLTTTDDVTITVNAAGPGAPVSFGRSTITGVDATFNGPTSLQFGPDGRLYIAEQKGLIRVYTIARNGPNSYAVTAKETIDLINETPNHNDQGALETGIQNRLTLGITVAGTATNPVIFASHSDPRITGGSNNGDLNLDTNSGMISRLKWNGSEWSKLDLVRGLPRSEENHATNGLQYDKVANILYVAQGGHTNMGAPSHDLAFLAEYALSAAILKIDLNQIGETTYDLPTLDDLSRSNTTGRTDVNDPFGGNDGDNQAVIVAGGPVQVYSPGYRNPYDVVLTRNGKMYTVDNGSNAGWGGPPLAPNGQPTTAATAGTATNAVSEPGVTYQDQLHYIPSQGFYGGHPAPTRANMANTFNGIYPIGGSTSQSPVPSANTVEGAYRVPGVDDGALTLFSASTNGLTEYTASNFGGAMNGDLLAVSYDNKLYRIKLDATGTTVVSKTVLINSVGILPLDVTAQGALGPFPGTIWAADYPGDQIVVFEPSDYDGNPGGGTGEYNPNIDEDFDGYDNADEIDNGTNPLSSGDFPPDFDQDFDSDLNDPNDDNDSLLDTVDPFAIDPLNGRGNNLPVSYQWENEGDALGGFLGLGWTGHMTNGVQTYLNQFDPTKMTAGGAAGVMTVDEIAEGTALGASNNQMYALQFGVNATPTTGSFYVHTRLLAPFAGLTPQAGQEMGLFFGNGNQDNYIKLVISGNSGGSVSFAKEVAGAVTQGGSVTTNLADIDALDLYIIIDPAANTARAVFTTTTDFATSNVTAVGGTQSFPAGWITGAAAPAVGVISTSNGPAPAFAGTWDMMEVVPSTPNMLRASAAVLSYGPILLGEPQTKQVTLTNAGGPGDPDITIDGTTFAGAGATAYSDSFDDSGTVTLAPGESVVLNVVFNPPAVGAKPATLSIAHSGSGSPLVLTLSGTGVVQGVLAEYYDTKDLTNLKSTRVEPDIDFIDSDWGSAPPGTGVTADDIYSERFTGYVKIDTGGAWTFTTDSNDGIRLWVNDQQIVNQWANGSTTRTGTINLQPGFYPIRVEHYQDTGSVKLQLSYQGPGQTKVIIPSSHLFTDGSPVSNNNRLGVSLTTVNFGNVFVGQSPTQNVTLTNLGAAGAPSIIVDATSISGSAAGDYSDSFNDAGNITLAPGESTVVTITFDPTVVGGRSALLEIVHSGGNSPIAVLLTGNGVSSSTGFWDTGATMPVKLGETAAGVINNKLYVIGDGADNTLAYDISTNTWVSNLAVRPQPGKDQIAHVINNKLYVFGGVANIGGTKTALDNVQIYDPVTNQWTTGQDVPYPVFAAATAVIGGEVYFAGGVGSNIQTIALTSKYNPATNQWTMLAPMPHARDSAPAGTNGSKLFLFGGRSGGDSPSNGFNTVQIYDPATNTWITSDDTSGPGAALAELPQARGGIVLAPFAGGEFYVIGGETKDGAGATADNVYDRVDIYNPVTNTWRLGVSMPTARHGMSPVFHNGRIYVPGGGTHSGKSQSNLLEILQLPV